MKTQSFVSFWRRGVALLTALLVVGLVSVPAARADDVAPAAPTNFSLTPADVSQNGQVLLTWSSSTATDVTGYQVYRFHGSGSPSFNEHTYLIQTDQTHHIDQLVNEGQYRYAVVAVDGAGNRSQPTLWKQVSVNLPANGGTVAPDTTAPAAPSGLAVAAAYSRTGMVELSWSGSTETDLWRYLIYRAEGDGAAAFLDYVPAGVRTYTETVTADNRYRYHVVAQDLSGNVSRPSESVRVTVDRVAPVVSITAPTEGLAYQRSGLLPVGVTITETGSGYEPGGLTYYLNGAQLTSPAVPLAELAAGTHQITVMVTDRAGNIGMDDRMITISDTAYGDAPSVLTASGISRGSEIALQWAAPAQEGVTGYQIYRITESGAPVLVGTTAATARSFTVAPGEGFWSFYVVAQYGTAYGTASNMVGLLVDQTSPTVSISSPANGKRYPATGTLPVTYGAADTLSGIAEGSVTLHLDGQRFTGGSIDLSLLPVGDHTLRVTAADRAGNQSYRQVRFTVSTAVEEDDDDEDDEDEDDWGTNDKGRKPDWIDLRLTVDAATQQAVIAELSAWEGQIQQGHFKALMAKAEAGAWRSFILHLHKHRGKFIPEEAAEELLQLLGVADLQIDPRSIPDSEIEGWGNGNKAPGKRQ